MAFARFSEREIWTVPGLALGVIAATWGLTRGTATPRVQLATQTNIRDAALVIRPSPSQTETPNDDVSPASPDRARAQANTPADRSSQQPPQPDTFSFPSPSAQAAIDDAHAAIDLIGKDAAASGRYVTAFSDHALSPDDRKGLLHDLGNFGTTAPTAQDVPAIDGRLTVVDQLTQKDWDEVTSDALDDTRHSLLDLRDAIVKT